jgi:hypothetical protein
VNDLVQTAPTLALTPENYRAMLEQPFLILPPEVRPAALKLWTCYRWLPGFDRAFSLAAMLAVWLGDWELTEAGACVALHALTDPARMAEVKFTSDLTTALAAAAQAEIKAERARVRKAEEEADRAAREPASPITDKQRRQIRDRVRGVAKNWRL